MHIIPLRKKAGLLCLHTAFEAVFLWKNMNNKILFISATHGNEEYSIKVLDSLEKKYPKSKYGYERLIGNPKALKKNIRYIDQDLNRSAPGDIKSKIFEEKRAAEIMKISEKFKYVIDLHGSNSKCGVTIIIPYPSIENILLSGLFDIKNVVIWYTKKSDKNVPLTQSCKPPGLEIECGPKNDPKISAVLKGILEKFLKEGKSMNIEKLIKRLKSKELYVVNGIYKSKNKIARDFKKVKTAREEFYSFMSANQYPGKINCYKMRKIKFEDLFLLKAGK